MKELIQVKYNKEIVITTKMLAEIYGCDENNIKKNFNSNKDKFIEGKHYYKLTSEELKQFKEYCKVTFSDLVKSNVNTLYLWTKRGASRHCKMLGTDRAWDMFDTLEENYFNPKEQQLQLPSYQISDPIERAKTWIKEEEERQRLALENKTLTTEVIHKEDVILGLTKDISLAEKRQRITQIVRFRCKGNYGERYGLLYSEFEKKYHIDLKRRMESCTLKPKVKNKMDYIDRGINMIPELYEIACKIFENDVDELRKEWEQTIERKINNLT